MPAVTIIVPTHRQPRFLTRAIRSILCQTFGDFEVIVIDNHPPCSRVVAEPSHHLWLSDSRVRVLEAPSARNPATLRNIGLAAARGEWITFLDDDDEYLASKLEEQLCRVQESGRLVTLCQLTYHVAWRRRARGIPEREVGGDDLLMNFPGIPALFHKRAPGVTFDESFNAAEDLHYFQRVLQHFGAFTVPNIPRALVNVYVQPDAHVNLNAIAVANCVDVTLNEFGARYSQSATRVLQLRARLGACKVGGGDLKTMICICAQILSERPLRDFRLVFNSLLFRIPFLRPLLVA